MVGIETTGTTLTNVSYNLAMNPEVQDKLIEEIDTVLDSHVIYFRLKKIFCL